ADFPIDPNKLTVQTFSDILRVRLLAQTGGIWTDASVYPTKPLSNWLHKHMEKYTFFIYDAANKSIPLSSSFIAARKDCPIIKKWHDLMCQYWFMEREPIPMLTHNDPFRLRHYIVINVAEEMGLTDMSATPQYPYWWLHHLVAYLLETDAEFRNLWETIDKLPASDHFAVFVFFYSQRPLKKWLYSHGFINQKKKARIQNYFHNANMQKLDWREKYPLRLFQRISKTP
ncbi:MAG: capsular polysaccharide synthesis protein, partial [Proteobacteria bacterium]|nr:capsular polysaccharide synthesis protein [Pseudomonadota bacterium]